MTKSHTATKMATRVRRPEVLFVLEYLVEKYEIEVTGIIRVGAKRGDDVVGYEAVTSSVDEVVWIEANPEFIRDLQMRVCPLGHLVIQAFVGPEPRDLTRFDVVTNDGVYSLHLPQITLDELNELYSFQGNTLIVTTRGSELSILRGAEELLPKIDYVQTRFTAEVLGDMDSLLAAHGFERVETTKVEGGRGDAFYRRI